MREGEPEITGAVRIWYPFGAADALVRLRIIDIAGEHTFMNDAHDEVLYDLANDEGIYVPAGIFPGERNSSSSKGFPASHTLVRRATF